MVSNGKRPGGAGPFFGRFLISFIFILAGLGKIFSFSETVDQMNQLGIKGATTFLFVGVAMEIIGGLLVLLGLYTRLGCYILMIFLIPATFIFHNFWSVDVAEQAVQLTHFLKNLTIYGGLLLLVSYGPGAWSFDARRMQAS